MIVNVRTVLRTITHCLGNSAYKRKVRKYPEKFFTLEQLCKKAELDTTIFDADVKQKLGQPVSYVCRFGDRFTKNCICVQLYADSDDLMKQAMRKGALVCVTTHKIDGVPCIVADNTASVYAQMCGIIRETAKTKTTVIAGSIGKTTTKKMVEAVYRQAFNTMCDSGNDNILDSVGSICQHLPEKSEQYIAELSEDTPGLIAEMSRITKPDVAILTAIDKSHIEGYGSEENIFNEFRSVTKYMRADGICIMSLDQPNAESLILDRKVVYVSVENREADFSASDIVVDNEGLSFNVVEKASGNIYPVRLINVYAQHNVTTALLAFAAGVVSGISYDKIVAGLQKYRATGIRQNVFKAGKTIVYADCYNAVAKSIRSAIEGAQKIPVCGKRIAVLGDVAEAGSYTESTHREIVDIVNTSSFDVVMTFGKNLKKALANMQTRENLVVLTFKNQKEMNKALKKQVKSGDLVLFKASHSGKLSASIASTFPVAYAYQAIKYYTPRLMWHFKVILN